MNFSLSDLKRYGTRISLVSVVSGLIWILLLSLLSVLLWGASLYLQYRSELSQPPAGGVEVRARDLALSDAKAVEEALMRRAERYRETAVITQFANLFR